MLGSKGEQAQTATFAAPHQYPLYERNQGQQQLQRSNVAKFKNKIAYKWLDHIHFDLINIYIYIYIHIVNILYEGQVYFLVY